ncbi:MAG: hypothetical protein IKB38_08855 [Clostridia bacterium]|nr:hypothetical protein [Clostridia bacterium]
MKENNENIRERVLSLIESEFDSDAAFERSMGLADKTVNNWRRGRSSSYMKMLPELSRAFGVNVGEILDMPIMSSTSELSLEEVHLLHLYRKARVVPPKMRTALRETLESIINLYIDTAAEMKEEKKKKSRSKQG